jgi:hypothetical protein
MTIETLQKRLDKLEECPSNESDLVDMVLAALLDQDLELLHEHAILREKGFDEEKISCMMADRWSLFQQAVERFSQAAIELGSQ